MPKSKEDISNASPEDFTREELQNFNVTDSEDIDLREIARKVVGRGAWVSHASKSDLIQAILDGRPPLNLQETRFGGSKIEREARKVDPEKQRKELRQELDATVTSLSTLISRSVLSQIRPLVDRLDYLEALIERELDVEINRDEEVESVIDAIQQDMVGQTLEEETA